MEGPLFQMKRPVAYKNKMNRLRLPSIRNPSDGNQEIPVAKSGIDTRFCVVRRGDDTL